MRCLYCGKQLPLLKKLTGGGEFCSEAHRQKYQEEYNKLALSRLLQTQNSDSEAPHRGELVLTSRQHPALQGRPPLRALEAPKSADSPLAGNWAPGANRTQRALPPPSTPVPQPHLNGAQQEVPPPAPVTEIPSFLKQTTRSPLPTPPPPPLARSESKPESFRFDQGRFDQGRLEQPKTESPARLEPAVAPKTNSKRDAFTFRPIEPFPVEKPAPAPPPPPVLEETPVLAAVAAAPPKPVLPAAKAPQPVDPPEAPFSVEEVRTQAPPPIARLEQLGAEPFNNGHPPKPDGWLRWDPEVQGPPGRLEELDELFPLTGPPGSSSIQIVSEREELEQERSEIRKKILENQVKPADFKQMVPTAPNGPNTVLPICPPAAALEPVAVSVKAKAPASNPGLYLIPPANGESLWTGWTLTGTAQVRQALTLIAPEVQEVAETKEVAAKADVPQAVVTPPAAPRPLTPPVGVVKSPQSLPVAAPKAPVVEPPRNYKAAEALKSAAQTVITETAPKVEVRQPEKVSMPQRHEVFVDLSVLGIEEDEDADAEFLAGEGESPPGGGGRVPRRKRNSNAREAVRDLILASHPAALPAESKLAQNFQAIAWKNTGIPTLRLAGLPLRPKVVFEPSVEAAHENAKQEPSKEMAKQQSSSLASAWSAKRLKKAENGAPPAAPGNSGPSLPVETQVSEPAATVTEVPKPALKPAEAKKIGSPAVAIPAQPTFARVVITKPATQVPAPSSKPVAGDAAPLQALAAHAQSDVKKPTSAFTPPQSNPKPTKAEAEKTPQLSEVQKPASVFTPPQSSPKLEPKPAAEPGKVPELASEVKNAPSVFTPPQSNPNPGPKTTAETEKAASLKGEEKKPATVFAPPQSNPKPEPKPTVETEKSSQPKDDGKKPASVPTPPQPTAEAQKTKDDPKKPMPATLPPSKPEAKPNAESDPKKGLVQGKKDASKNDSRKGEGKRKEPKAAEKPVVNAAKPPNPEPLPEKAPFDAPLLGVGASKNNSFWANLPVLPKVAIALGLAAAIGGGAWFTLNPSGKAATTAENPKKILAPARAGRSLMMNMPGGWSPDWGGDFNRKKNRTISLYRPSVNNDDYRMEFEGQIDSKGLGWVYRAVDPKNYFAYKIELVRTGPEPGAAMTHFTVVNGVESQKHYSALAKPIRAASSFKVRLDVRGDEYSAYINDELIEVWQDDRLLKGGFGVMTELGEVGQIRKLQVFELMP